jgi:hypothetical protein
MSSRAEVDRRIRQEVVGYLEGRVSGEELPRRIDRILLEAGRAQRKRYATDALLEPPSWERRERS